MSRGILSGRSASFLGLLLALTLGCYGTPNQAKSGSAGSGGSTGGTGGTSGRGGSGTGGSSGSGGTGGASACAGTCESFQYCAGVNRCLPTYVSTRVLAVNPAMKTPAITVSDAVNSIPAAIVATNGDLFVQTRVQGQVVFGTGTATSVVGSTDEFALYKGLARYSSSGTLQWARDMMLMLGDSVNFDSIGPVALAANGNFVVAYNRGDPPPPPPGTPTSQYRVALVDGGNPAITWEASFGINGPAATYVAPRTARNDVITTAVAPDQFHGCCSSIQQVTNNGAMVKNLGAINYATGTVPGRDGSTLWMYGAYAGTLQLNPWSTMTYNVPANPSQFGMYDAFIIGAKDDGTSFGPWITQGDVGPGLLGFALPQDGKPIVTMAGTAPVRINGQDVITSAGQAIFKLDAAAGTVVWKTDIPDSPNGLAIVDANQDAATVPLQMASPTVRLYAGTDGSARSSFTVPGTVHQLVGSPGDLYIVGVVSTAADFNPGAGVDVQGATPGIFISHYTF